MGSFSELVLADLEGELKFCDFGFSLRILEFLGKPAKLKHILQDLSNSRVLTAAAGGGWRLEIRSSFTQ